jgi:uncharacterized protein
LKRLVLDTNVIVSGLLWHGPPRTLLERARGGEFRIYSSIPMLAELGNTLMRPKFGSKMAAAGATLDDIVAGYAALVTLVRPEPIAPVAPDPDDDVVIATAVAARASLIITGDKPLLSIGQYQEIAVVNTTDALNIHLLR